MLKKILGILDDDRVMTLVAFCAVYGSIPIAVIIMAVSSH